MKSRQPNTKFDEININENSIICFLHDHNIKATVKTGNKVSFNENEYSLTELTRIIFKEILHSKNFTNPFLQWIYEGEILVNRRKRIEKERLIKELQKLHSGD